MGLIDYISPYKTFTISNSTYRKSLKMSTVAISPRQSEWEKPSVTDIVIQKDMKLPHRECECGEAGDFFHYFGVKLNDAKSVEEFKAQTIALIRHIWLASHAQRMSPCIITAVRECIDTYKRTKLPVGPVVQFYNFRLEGKSLPVWIILHSPSDDPSLEPQVGIRHYLLQTFMDEITLTKSIRDELYSTCARTSFNNFFSRVRLESLRQLQGHPRPKKTHANYIEIGHGLRSSSGLAETVKVVNTRSGFKMTWFVPEMLQKLESNLFVGIEFVAKGQVWGMYIQAESGQLDTQWQLGISPFKPSQVNLEGKYISVSFSVSRYSKRKVFSRGSTVTERLCSTVMSTLDLPEGGMPNTRNWPFSSHQVHEFHRCINEDGSCYLILTLRTPALSQFK